MGMLFGPARLPSYISSFGRRQPRPASEPLGAPPLAAPQQPAAPAGGAAEPLSTPPPPRRASAGGQSEDSTAQFLAPPPPPAMTRDQRFQQSLDNERAQNARSAQIFAAAAPLPKDDASSAYGSVAASQAARDAYVDKAATASNLNSGNYYVNRNFAQEANDRQNTENAAKAGLTNAETDELNLMAPARRDALNARTAATTSETGLNELMAPKLRDQVAAGTDAMDAETAAKAAGLPFIAPKLKQDLAAGGAQLDRYQQQTPGVVAGSATAAADSDAIFKRERELLQQEQALNKQKYEQTPATDPTAQASAAFDLDQKRRKAANDAAQQRYNEQHGFFGTGIGRGAFSGYRPLSEFQEEEYKKMNAPPPAKPSPTANGATHVMADGTPIKLQSGKWVNASTGVPVK